MVNFRDPIEVCLTDVVSGIGANRHLWAKLTVTSSTLVKLPVSNKETTSSMVISRRLAEARCARPRDFWATSTGKATPLTMQTEQQASQIHFLDIIEVPENGC